MDCAEHYSFECEFFQNEAKSISKNLLINNYPINALLKLLLLHEDPATAEKCKDLLPHNFKLDEYRDSAIWLDHDENIVQPLVQSGFLDTLKRTQATYHLDADFLHKLCILIDANAFEVSSKISGDSLKGVYVHAAKMPHNCVPNAATSIDDDYNMRIYAGVPIKAGEIIYNSFTNPLMVRRNFFYAQLRSHGNRYCGSLICSNLLIICLKIRYDTFIKLFIAIKSI